MKRLTKDEARQLDRRNRRWGIWEQAKASKVLHKRIEIDFAPLFLWLPWRWSCPAPICIRLL